jgi:hypothetical protein
MEVISYSGIQLNTSAGGEHYSSAGGQLNNSTETEMKVISYAGMQLNFHSCRALQYRR